MTWEPFAPGGKKRHARAPWSLHGRDATVCGIGLTHDPALAQWPAGISCRNCLAAYYLNNEWVYGWKRFKNINRIGGCWAHIPQPAISSRMTARS